jgi:uncharacterized membrane protein (Fun14 family)
MVVPVLNTGMETTIFSFGGGGILGVMAGMAFKRVVKFAAIIVGLFVLGIEFLSYRGWITANWNTIQDQTQSFAYNASAQAINMINDTASKFVQAHSSSLAHAEAAPISAAIGFSTGFVLGLRN